MEIRQEKATIVFRWFLPFAKVVIQSSGTMRWNVE